MYHHDRSLIVVLIVALFSLASLQGLNLLLKNQSNVLGETSTTYKCCTDSQCIGQCSYRTTPCSAGTFQCNAANPPAPYLTPIPTTRPPMPTTVNPPTGSSGAIPCELINQIQRQYCQATTNPIPSPRPTSFEPTKAPTSTPRPANPTQQTAKPSVR